jgi:hypothetical protein
VSKRNNPSTAAAPEVDPSAALEETRAKVQVLQQRIQSLQQQREENRHAHNEAVAGQDIDKVRKLKATHTDLTSEIEAVAAVLEASQKIIDDIEAAEATKAQAESRRNSVDAVRSELKAVQQAYAEVVRAIYKAEQSYREAREASQRARQIVVSLRDSSNPRLLDQYDTALNLAGVPLSLQDLVKRLMNPSPGLDVTALDYLRATQEQWRNAASYQEQLFVSELERALARALEAVTHALPTETPPVAA